MSIASIQHEKEIKNNSKSLAIEWPIMKLIERPITINKLKPGSLHEICPLLFKW